MICKIYFGNEERLNFKMLYSRNVIMMSTQHFNSFSLMITFEGLDVNSTVTLKRDSVR